MATISLWDTAGEERFLSLSSCYYRDADAVLLLYSVQSQLSFDSLPHWVYVARQYCPDGRGPGATPAVRGQRGPSSQSPLRRSRLCSLPDSGFPRPADGSGSLSPGLQAISHEFPGSFAKWLETEGGWKIVKEKPATLPREREREREREHVCVC
uniref:Uncharacterized protein n=1 Tax=Gopherus evgoodei TaxID=1825980 RepID=A0A8C4XVN8_9SAUR